MTKPSNLESIEKATNRSWDDWLKLLNNAGAEKLKHGEIADLAFEAMDDSVESAGWWSQGVAVAYEQSIGRRAPGQKNDGTFELSVSRTIAGSREDVFAKCLELADLATDFSGKAISNARTSVTPVRSYWKCNLDDNSKITWAVEQKSDDKQLIVITHANLASSEDADAWRVFWKKYLEENF